MAKRRVRTIGGTRRTKYRRGLYVIQFKLRVDDVNWITFGRGDFWKNPNRSGAKTPWSNESVDRVCRWARSLTSGHFKLACGIVPDVARVIHQPDRSNTATNPRETDKIVAGFFRGTRKF
jgi:hypothetical protein